MLYRFRFLRTALFAVAASSSLIAFGPAPGLSRDLSELQSVAENSGGVSGELKKWHRVTITFDGPAAEEQGGVNPFLDYRLNVLFTSPAGQTYLVPGHFAADGNAAETGAAGGNKWRVHFMPNAEGQWSYVASFRAGREVAVSAGAGAGAAAAFDGARGSFQVAPSDKAGRDHRAKGLLRSVGRRYWQFQGTGEYFLKGGANSPETLLAYEEFDGTYAHDGGFLHKYAPHVRDWRGGDPTWRGGKGRGLVGALNYLAEKGMNAVYFLTMSVGGDGKNVWPWTAHTERARFDVSKLDQWEAVFTHMDRLGLMLHVVTQETENDQLLDGGALGAQRRLYYRELVSRFAHHPALAWNLGEETTNTDQERAAFAAYIRELDAYDHPIVVHTFPGEYDRVYAPLLGSPVIDGASLQLAPGDAHRLTREWLARSAARPWAVYVDEINPQEHGVLPDAHDPAHDVPRRDVLWANLMAGGAGVEWYFGYNWPHSDLNAEDWRSRDAMWDQTRHALDFFRQHLPFAEMAAADELTHGARTLAKPGGVYAVYLPVGGATQLSLPDAATYSVQWYNPRAGGALQHGTVTAVAGPGRPSIGSAPFSGDAVALVRRGGSPPPPPPPVREFGLQGEYFDDRHLTVHKASRLDPQVWFNWGRSLPHSGLADDGEYGVKWKGEILIDAAGVWNFYTVSNDGVRLYVDGQLVINDWTQHAAKEDAGSVALGPGWHQIEIHYYQQGGTSEMRLSFAGPGQAKAAVPAERLRP
jgi:hypothetical protein